MKYFVALFMFVSIACDAQVRITHDGDTLKGKVKKITELSVVAGEDTIKTIYTCDITNRTEMAYFYSYMKTLAGKWIVSYDIGGHIIEMTLYADSSRLCSRLTCKYDGQGRKIEQLSVDNVNDHCELMDRLSGQLSNWPCCQGIHQVFNRYEYDSSGHLARKKEWDYSDKVDDTMLTITDYIYNSKGSLLEAKESVSGRYENEVSEIRIRRYDESGNKVEENRYDQSKSILLGDWYNNGTPITTKNIFKYDSSNRLIEAKEYFITGNGPKPSSGTKVGSIKRYTYDSFRSASYTSYTLIRLDNGLEVKDNAEETHGAIDRKKGYDSYGNIVTKMDGDSVTLWREIEYY